MPSAKGLMQRVSASLRSRMIYRAKVRRLLTVILMAFGISFGKVRGAANGRNQAGNYAKLKLRSYKPEPAVMLC
jgi:hypothetical protein